MGRLILRLLGTPEVSHAEKALAFQTRKVLALLAYLAVEPGIHTRDKITALLWPESDEERGRASLRRALAYLRDTLDEVSHGRSSNQPLQLSHVLVDHETLRFNTASDCEVDIQILQTAFSLTRRSSANLRTHLTQLQVAASSYRGNFLEGLMLPDAPDFDDWLLLQREGWRRQANTVFDHLSQLQADGGELENALDTASQWITHDLLNETAHARLMQLHFALGDRAAALQAYEYCRFILERELGAEPAAELKVLAARIRSQSSPLRQPMAYESPTSQTAWEPPLIGRILEYRALVRMFHTMQQGHMQVATLEGEPGIGKTRLAREFLMWARAQGADVLAGRAFETGSRLPYQSLVEALRSHLEDEQSLKELLSDVWLSELARLLPELREQFPALPPPLMLDETEARTRLFESVARLGQALAGRTPIVIFIDDMQWADAASLDLLQYASRRWATAHIPVFVLCTLRSEDLASSVSLAALLSSLERDLSVMRQTLTSLSYEHTLRLVQSLFSVDDDGAISGGSARVVERERHIETLGRWLFTETGGHPFFLVESLKALTEQGGPFREEAGTVTIYPELITRHDAGRSLFLPSSVRDLIHARLTHLSHNALTMCKAGAVLGDGFTFEQLCHVADIDESQALPALDELLTRGLLRETDEKCFFTHDKIREEVYAEIGKIRRRVFHRRALTTLQASFSPPAELARHAFAAGLPAAALHLSIAAGNEAMRVFAASDAIAHFEQARRLVRNVDEYELQASEKHVALSLADLSQLYLQLGWAYELRNEFVKEKSIYEEMLAVAREMSEPAMECTSLNRLATLAAQNGQDFARAEELLQQALNVAESSQNKAGVAETLWNLAQTGFYAGKMQASLPHAEQALILARELQQQELTARSLHALATLEMVLGEWEKSLSHADEAHMLYTALGNHVREVGCLCVIAQSLINMGQPQDGIDAARAALVMSVEIEDNWGQINAAIQMVPGLLDTGAYTEARSVIQQGVSLARALEITPLLVISLNEWGNVCRAMFELDAAKAAHNEALTLCEGFMPPHYVGWIAGELCADCASANQWQEAYTYAVIAETRRDISIMHGGLARWHETEALLWGGSIEQAKEVLRRFGERVEDKRRYRIPYLQACAVLARWENKTDHAIAHLESARVLAEQLDLPGELWQILAALGVLYQSSENDSQSLPVFSHAVQVVQSLADRIEDEQQRLSFLSAQQVRALFTWNTTVQ